MRNISIVKKPGYAIESVDKALQLLILLQEREWLRIADAAEELGVARSTAHRLLGTLVYRGFALQDDQRRYCAGPNLRDGASQRPARALVAVARPHLEALAAAVRETVNFVERVGITAHFLFSAEGPQLVRVGNRAGTILPARTSSGGKAALATLPPSAVEQLYSGSSAQRAGSRLSTADLQALQQDLADIRARGYSLNLGRTESEVVAIGAPLGPMGKPGTFALTISAPISRAADLQEPSVVGALLATCKAVRRDLEAEGLAPRG